MNDLNDLSLPTNNDEVHAMSHHQVDSLFKRRLGELVEHVLELE
jgi:hypothetical protein